MNRSKTALRALWKEKRQAVSPSRRSQAVMEGQTFLLDLFQKARHILSYSSFDDEFETHLLNRALAAEKKLLLPKIKQQTLQLYHVLDLDQDLAPHPWGIMQPTARCIEFQNLHHLDLILVPALAFDDRGHRLGYGKGYYDRFLAQIPASVATIGVGFQEQLSPHSLALDPWDLPLKQILLF